MTQATGQVFLSASVPYRRPDRYVADETAVGEAVRALVAEVVPERPLVFGGHPAISPMVWDAASSQGAADNVYIYQSELYRAFIPPEAKFFEAIDRLIWTPLNRPNASRDNPADRDACLLTLREWMILKRRRRDTDPPLPPFDAGVFIGGMEGVEDEWKMFTTTYPGARALPIGSTEGAARLLLDDPINSGLIPAAFRDTLAVDLDYRDVFRRVLP
jgi:hypothetical protein